MPNAAMQQGDAARAAHAHGGQPFWRPSISGRTSSVRASVSSPAPVVSIPLVRSARDSAIRRGASPKASAPIGILIRNTQRHPSPSRSAPMRAPPTTWPPIEAIPITIPVTNSHHLARPRPVLPLLGVSVSRVRLRRAPRGM
jgi:hypothetical protein